MSKVLVIDNYDSFTYNLVQYLGELGAELIVHRNDQIDLDTVRSLDFDQVVISPGPGVPSDAGISIDLIRELSGTVPILGVCLGHQAIGEAFGGCVIRAGELRHGKTSLIYHEGDTILAGLEAPFEATRYHSLIIDPLTLPEDLVVNARTEEGIIMGFRHREFDVFGVQFHPESIMTGEGKKLLGNFLCYGNTAKDSKPATA